MNRSKRRHLRRKFIKRRWRDWMAKYYVPGEFAKGYYLGRGCYCSRCVGGRTKWKNIEREKLKQELKEFV